MVMSEIFSWVVHFATSHEVGFIIVPILQVGKLRHQRLKDLAQITQLMTELRFKPLSSGYTARTPVGT